jgi:hypothetical protein
MKTEAFTTARASNTRLANNLFVSNLLQIGIVLSSLVVLVNGQTTSSACDNCITCNAAKTSCTKCDTDYYLFGAVGSAKCLACSSDCSGCSGTSTSCTNCKTSFYLFGSTCKPCSTGCAYCSSGTSCQYCSVGYYLSNGGCLKCPSTCNDCRDINICTNCTAGYLLQSGNCIDSSPQTQSSSSLQASSFIGITIGGIICLALIGVCVCCMTKKGTVTKSGFGVAAGSTHMGSGYPSAAPSMMMQNASFQAGYGGQPAAMMQPMGYGGPASMNGQRQGLPPGFY